ncbi:hypothetical protein LMG27198_29070 [Methylocystis echinoides]|uniref:Uncharacterized protein n=1 Tax=Methylocystis echinoides TaxID=29468 RepID=A0A9W6GW33_9HYPH|nr:hypothetical protein LMG27198_29070 [Methylocystis echinoides]
MIEEVIDDPIVNQPGVAPVEGQEESLFPSLSVIHETLQQLQELAPDFYSAVQQCINESGFHPDYHDALAMLTSAYLLLSETEPGSNDFAVKLSAAFGEAVFMCEVLKDYMPDENDPVIIGNALKFAAYAIISEQDASAELVALAHAKSVESQRGWSLGALADSFFSGITIITTIKITTMAVDKHLGRGHAATQNKSGSG